MSQDSPWEVTKLEELRGSVIGLWKCAAIKNLEFRGQLSKLSPGHAILHVLRSTWGRFLKMLALNSQTCYCPISWWKVWWCFTTSTDLVYMYSSPAAFTKSSTDPEAPEIPGVHTWQLQSCCMHNRCFFINTVQRDMRHEWEESC